MRPPLLVAAAVVALAARAAEVAPPPLRVWHITDVHIDPYYVPGADATSCYCDITHPEGGHPGCDQPTTCAPACNCSLKSHGGAPNTPNGFTSRAGDDVMFCPLLLSSPSPCL